MRSRVARSAHRWVAVGVFLLFFVASAPSATAEGATVNKAPFSQDGPAIFRNGVWYLGVVYSTTPNPHPTATVSSFAYGDPGDQPLLADWDADGLTTPAVVRGSRWYVRNQNTTGVADMVFTYGDPGDIPIVGDWDGNGTETPGVFRGNTWYLRNSNSSGVADMTCSFGDAGDLPIVGDWDADGDDDPGVARPDPFPSAYPVYLRDDCSTGIATHPVIYNPRGLPFVHDSLPPTPQTANPDLPGSADAGAWYERFTLDQEVVSSYYYWGDPGDIPLWWRAP